MFKICQSLEEYISCSYTFSMNLLTRREYVINFLCTYFYIGLLYDV